MKKLLLSFILISTLSFSSYGQCTITSPATNDVTTNYLAGQGFTASCSGFLNYVQFTANTTGTIPAGTLTIYNGNAVVTSIHTQSFSAITIASIGDPIRINLSSAVAITNGNQYTFEFFVNLNLLAGLGTYAGGDAFQAGTIVTGIDTDFEVDITTAVGIDEISTSTTTIFPNPATNMLNITTDDQIETVSIYSINGALVKTGNQKTMNISNLDKGMYIVTVQTDKGITRTRLIKE